MAIKFLFRVGWGKCSKIDLVMVAQLIIHSKWVNYMACGLYLNKVIIKKINV